MKCLIFVQNYPPEIGPVRYTYDLANSLNESDHKISVITGIPHYPTGRKYPGFETIEVIHRNENGIEVIRTPILCASNTQPIKRILGFITFFFSALPHLFQRKDFDLIIVSIPPFTVLFLGIVGKLLFKIPFIVLLRDFEPYSSLNLRRFLTNKFIHSITKLLSQFYRIADVVVATHSSQLNSINEMGLTFKILKVIPHPVEIKHFDLSSNFRSNSDLSRSNRNLVGLYIGTFGKSHSLPELIKSLTSREIAELPIDFIFIGDGEDSIKCKKIANASNSQNVKIYETVSFEEVPGKIQQADFLIYSLKPNIFMDIVGAKFYEYFASAKPILACGKSAVIDIIKQVGNGWWIDSMDSIELYNCLKRIMKDKSEFDMMGALGRDYIQKISSANSFGENWNQLCRSLIKSLKS